MNQWEWVLLVAWLFYNEYKIYKLEKEKIELKAKITIMEMRAP